MGSQCCVETSKTYMTLETIEGESVIDCMGQVFSRVFSDQLMEVNK